MTPQGIGLIKFNISAIYCFSITVVRFTLIDLDVQVLFFAITRNKEKELVFMSNICSGTYLVFINASIISLSSIHLSADELFSPKLAFKILSCQQRSIRVITGALFQKSFFQLHGFSSVKGLGRPHNIRSQFWRKKQQNPNLSNLSVWIKLKREISRDLLRTTPFKRLYIHLIAITLSYKKAKTNKEKSQVGVN